MSTKSMARPRRLEDKIVSYMLGVLPLIEASGVVPRGSESMKQKTADNEDDADDIESRKAALKNVVKELKFQTASAATDKRTAMILEVLAQAAGPECATMLLSRCAPYAAFIASNRHGSHVLQTILSLVGEHIASKTPNFSGGGNNEWWEDREGTKSSDDDVDEDDEEEANLDPIQVLVTFWQGLVGAKEFNEDNEEENDDAMKLNRGGGNSESTPAAATIARNIVHLSCDMCSTHVFRSLLCILAGVPVVQERRGKHSKHGHSVQLAVSAATLRTQTRFPVHSSLQQLWDKTYSILAGGVDQTTEDDYATSVELQSMSCDSFGSATMVLLLELEATSNISNRNKTSKPSNTKTTPTATTAGYKTRGDQNIDDGPLADWSNQSIFGVLGDDESISSTTATSSQQGLKLIKKLLEWDNKDRSIDVVYGLAGEVSASHLLEAILRYVPESFFIQLIQRCLIGQFAEYAEHSVGNFVVQTFLRVARNPNLVATVIKNELLPALANIAKNTGILWRLSESVCRFDSNIQLLNNNSSTTLSINKKSKTSSLSSTEKNNKGTEVNVVEFDNELVSLICYHILDKAAMFKDRMGADIWPPTGVLSQNRAVEAVYRLLSPTLPKSSSSSSTSTDAQQGRLKLDVPGTHTLGNLITISQKYMFNAEQQSRILKDKKNNFIMLNDMKQLYQNEKKNTIRSFIIHCIVLLPNNLLTYLGQDSLGSRCIIQPCFELFHQIHSYQKLKKNKNNKNYNNDDDVGILMNLFYDLSKKGLKNKWVDIAMHNVGQHTLRVAFQSSDVTVKQMIAEELAIHAKNKLLGSSGGRNSLRLVNMDAFLRSKEEWLRNMKHGENTKALFEDILEEKSSKKLKLSNDNSTSKTATTSITNGKPTKRSENNKLKKRKTEINNNNNNIDNNDEDHIMNDNVIKQNKKKKNSDVRERGEQSVSRLLKSSSKDQDLLASLGFKQTKSSSTN